MTYKKAISYSNCIKMYLTHVATCPLEDIQDTQDEGLTNAEF
jgi:hypothetical protein